MTRFGLKRRLAAEALGTGFLVAAVVGSGMMGARLAGGNDALALLGNTGATGAVLYVLILVLGPVSGAHFNPAVTLAFLARREITAPAAVCYVLVQLLGALAGVWAAHLMFAEPVLQFSTTARTGAGQWLSEFIAAFGLVAAILGALRWRPEAVPAAVGLFIAAAYWFTASTGFANPAVTVARALTDTFTGIGPRDVWPFVAAQCLGALAATGTFAWLFGHGKD